MGTALCLCPKVLLAEGRQPTGPVISADRQDAVVKLVDPGEMTGEFGQLEADSIAIGGGAVAVTYRGTRGGLWQLRLTHESASCDGGVVRGGACVHVDPGDDVGWQLGEMVLVRIEELATPLWSMPAQDSQDSPASRSVASATVRRPHSLPWWVPVENWASMALWVLLAGLLAATVGKFWQRPWMTDLLPLIALAAIAFSTRLFLATWGPGDLRQPDDSFIGDWGVPATYGATTATLGRLFAWLPIGRDRLLVIQSLLLGSLAVLPVWGAARKLTQSTWAAWLAAGSLATQPLLVRFSGEANRQGVLLFLGAIALWALVRGIGAKPLLHVTLGLVAIALLLGTRPEAFLFVGFLGVLLLLLPVDEGGQPRWMRLGPLFVMGLLVTLQLFRLSNAGELGQGVSTLESTVGGALSLHGFPYVPAVMVHLNMDFTPPLFIALYAIGSVVGLWQRRLWVIWGAVALVLYALPLAGVPRGVDGGMQLASARYQTLTLIPFSLVLALGAEWLLSIVRPKLPPNLTPWALAALCALALAATLPALVRVTRPTALDHEYRFLREAIAKLPPNSELFSAPLGDSGLSPPTYLPAAVGRPDVTWRFWPDQWEPSKESQFVATQSGCSFILMTAPRKTVDGELAEDGGRRECALASQYVENFSPEPHLQEEIELRSFLRADLSQGTMYIGIYPLHENLVGELLDPGVQRGGFH